MKSRPESSAGREGEKSAGGGVMLAEAGGITTYLFVLSISLIPRRGFYAPPLPEEMGDVQKQPARLSTGAVTPTRERSLTVQA